MRTTTREPTPSWKPRTAWRAAALVTLIGAGGCAPDPQRFEPVADVKDLMLSVLEPAAEEYWDAVGWILDADGVHEIVPQNNEEWEAVRNAAFVIAESGNLLMMGGRAVDRDEWADFSRAMVETGRDAIRAAEARNVQGVFDAGAEVYYACSNCHASYAQETLRPSDTRSVGVDASGATEADEDVGAEDPGS